MHPHFPKVELVEVFLQVVTGRLVVGLQLHGDPELAHRLLRGHEAPEDDAKVPVAEAVADEDQRAVRERLFDLVRKHAASCDLDQEGDVVGLGQNE